MTFNGIITSSKLPTTLTLIAILSALFIGSKHVVAESNTENTKLSTSFSYSAGQVSGPIFKQQLCNGLCICDKHLKHINCTQKGINSLSDIAIPKSVISLLLDKNHISVIPKGIFQKLPNLEFLGISFNNISKIEKQSICAGKSLYHLYLQFNFISDFPEDFFRNCTTLRTLKLNTNYILIEDVARVLPYMPNITTLDLSNNQFQNSTILPPGFASLKHLQYLFMNDVDIRNLSDDFFNGLDTSQLLELSLMKNVMVKVSNRSFERMDALKYLDISYTTINVQNAVDIFHGLRDSDLRHLNMMYIYVYTDSDGVLEPHMFKNLHNTSLKVLHMEGNYGGFHGSLSKNFFAHIHHLEQLYLDHNELKTIHPKTFNRLHKLKKLSLTRNYLSCLVDCAFLQTEAMFPSLEILDLSNNVIDNNAGFIYFASRYFPRLRHLSLRKNRLTSIAVTYFQSLKSLRSLDLSENPIYIIEPGSFASLMRLKTLTIEDCFHIKALLPHVFNGLTSLEMLKLNGNGITSLSGDIWEGLSSLLHLDLRNNNLGGSESVLFNMSMPSHNLTLLDLSYNDIEMLPWKLFVNQSQIVVINLNHNRITQFNATYFKKLTELKSLDLSYNDILSIPLNGLTGLENLTYLNLEGNPFHCDCDLKHSQQWLLENTAMLIHAENTKCAGPATLIGTPILTYTPTSWSCNTAAQIAVLTIIFILAVILVVLSILVFIKIFCHIKPVQKNQQQKTDKYSNYVNGNSNGELKQTESQVAINSIETVDTVSQVSEHSNGDCTHNDTACFSLSEVFKKRKSQPGKRLKNGGINSGNEPLMDNLHESQSSI